MTHGNPSAAHSSAPHAETRHTTASGSISGTSKTTDEDAAHAQVKKASDQIRLLGTAISAGPESGAN